MSIVNLTKGQLELVSWGLEAMGDYWTDDAERLLDEGKTYDESCLPRIDGCTLCLSEYPEVNSDLYYRICEQLRDMVSSEPLAVARSQTRMINAIGDKLKAVGVLPQGSEVTHA